MEKHFATYNQALALKDLGFDEPCLAAYIDKTLKGCGAILLNVDGFYINHNNETDYVVATPLKSQVFKWFRDEYKLIAYIEQYAEWNFEIFRIDENIAEVQDDVCFDYNFKGGTYEEAESACIDKLISIIKEKKS